MELQACADALRRFARDECSQEPLYVALCECAAQSAEALRLMALAPPEQRKPNLLLAALHECVLADAAVPLAPYFPSVGGTRAPDADLPQALADTLATGRAVLQQRLMHGATQTNEVARSAPLRLALDATARLTGARHLALFDLGCSAGLNLGVDHYAVRYTAPDGSCHARGPAPDGTRVEIDARWLDAAPPPAAVDWRLGLRQGVDPALVRLDDPQGLRWLQACLWPHDAARRERLRRAVAQCQVLPLQCVQADDAVAALRDWVQRVPAGMQAVLLTSWVLYYFSEPALQALRDAADTLALSHGLAWVCGELPALSAPGVPVPPLPDLPAGEVASSATLWRLRWAEGGSVHQRLLGWSHPHGRWVGGWCELTS
ncbi:DUF2332 family protein [Roseateles sp. BYS87W]|uniref:DUF2332 family protein n=1 Tax=Pelomonas baiyunensis TaxID=3299026 RepID=A0ABW7H184_9BURK